MQKQAESAILCLGSRDTLRGISQSLIRQYRKGFLT